MVVSAAPRNSQPSGPQQLGDVAQHRPLRRRRRSRSARCAGRSRRTGAIGGSGAVRFIRWNETLRRSVGEIRQCAPARSKYCTSWFAGRPRLTSTWLYSPASARLTISVEMSLPMISYVQPGRQDLLQRDGQAVRLLAAGAGRRPDPQPAGWPPGPAPARAAPTSVSAVNGSRSRNHDVSFVVSASTIVRWYSGGFGPLLQVGQELAPRWPRRPAGRPGAAGPRPGTPCRGPARSTPPAGPGWRRTRSPLRTRSSGHHLRPGRPAPAFTREVRYEAISSSGSTASASPASTTAPGMPQTTELASSWATHLGAGRRAAPSQPSRPSWPMPVSTTAQRDAAVHLRPPSGTARPRPAGRSSPAAPSVSWVTIAVPRRMQHQMPVAGGDVDRAGRAVACRRRPRPRVSGRACGRAARRTSG